MVELDGDDVRISSRGKVAERDIVQVRYFSLSGVRNSSFSTGLKDENEHFCPVSVHTYAAGGNVIIIFACLFNSMVKYSLKYVRGCQDHDRLVYNHIGGLLIFHLLN